MSNEVDAEQRLVRVETRNPGRFGCRQAVREVGFPLGHSRCLFGGFEGALAGKPLASGGRDIRSEPKSDAWLHLRAALLGLLSLSFVGACASSGVPLLEAMDRKVELERFMGDWYVIGFIPITIPFFSEADAHNGVESYRLGDDGVIETTYTFREGAFDGPERRFTPKGWVHNEETNAEWRMQFLWPFEAAYLIVYLDPDYQKTIIGVPDRSHVWIMSRDPEMSEADYRRMLERAEGLGYDSERIQRVPQRWPEG